jgi:SOS-response transcriptional repressor LexA
MLFSANLPRMGDLSGGPVLAERLYILRHSARLSQEELARKSGISIRRIHDIENGANPTLDTLRKLASGLGISLSELTGGELPLEPIPPRRVPGVMAPSPGAFYVSDRTPTGAKPIPVISWASAGDGLEYTDQGYPPGASDEWIDRPVNVRDRRAYAVRVVGDSMSPVIQAGDLVVLIHDQEPSPHDIVLVKLKSGEVFLKLLSRHDGHFVLVSANPLYPPLVVALDELMFPPRKVAAIFKR